MKFFLLKKGGLSLLLLLFILPFLKAQQVKQDTVPILDPIKTNWQNRMITSSYGTVRTDTTKPKDRPIIIRTNWQNQMIVSSYGNLRTDTTNSRPYPLKTNWQNKMLAWSHEACIEILEDNLLLIKSCGVIADPDLDKYPDLYLAYDIGGIEGRNRILKEDLTETDEGLFEACFFLEIDLSDFCSNSSEAPFINDLPIYISLQTKDLLQKQYSIYPAFAYQDEGQLFPRELFGDINFPGVEKIKRICCNAQYLRADEFYFEVFPNPISNQLSFNVNTLSDEPCYLLVRNISGQIITNQVLDGSQISIDNWESGLYFITIRQGANRFTKKVIKN